MISNFTEDFPNKPDPKNGKESTVSDVTFLSVAVKGRGYLSTEGTVLQNFENSILDLNATMQRNICTVINMMRSMLKGPGPHKHLCAEEITAASYVSMRAWVWDMV